MYNADIKQRYIDHNPNNNHQFEKVMTNYFNRAEETEKRLKKDLALFTSGEIQAMYVEFLTPSFNMLVVINNQFLNYTKWYMKEIGTKDNQNHYQEMYDDVLMRCVSYAAQKSTYLSKNNVLDMISQFQNPYEAFFVLALFEGIKGEQLSDFFDLSMENFDKKTGTVTLPNNRVLTVSPELYHYAEQSSDEYVIYNIMGDPTNRGRFLEADKRIIKCSASSGFESEKRDRASIFYRTLRKIKRYDFVPHNISITSIAESGRVNMVKEIMSKENLETAEQVFKEYRSDIEYRYGHIPSLPKWLIKYGDFCKRG